VRDLRSLRVAAWHVFAWGVIAFACLPLIFYLFVEYHFWSSALFVGVGSLSTWLLAIGFCRWRCRLNLPESDSDGASSARVTRMLQEIWWIGFIFLGSPICFVAISYILKAPSKFDLWEVILVAILFMNLERFLVDIEPLEIPILRRLQVSQWSKKAINLTGWLLLAAIASVVVVGVIVGAYAEAIRQRIDAMNRLPPPYTAAPPYTVPPPSSDDGQ